MANNIAYIEKVMPRVVDKVLARESLTDSLIGGNEIKLDFIDAKTVKITKLASTGLQKYNRAGNASGSTNAKGAVQSTHETFTLSQERFSAIPLDKLDTLDDGETVLGVMASEFIRTKVVPEFDAYRFAKLASYTSTTFGNRVEEAISDNTIISKFNAAFKWMAEQKVPEGDQVIYVNPSVMEQIRNTTELAKRLHPVSDEMKKDIQFSIEMYENRPIVVVPSDQFFTAIDTSGSGYSPKSGAKIMNFLVVSKRAPIIVKKLAWDKIYDSDQVNLGYVGYEFDNLYYHDLFVSENMTPCIYASVSNTSATGIVNGLLVNIEAATGANKYDFVNAITKPAGLIWDAIGLYTTDGTAPSIGSSFATKDVAEVASDGTVTKKNFTADASHNIFVATLGGKVVAFTKDFESNLVHA